MILFCVRKKYLLGTCAEPVYSAGTTQKDPVVKMWHCYCTVCQYVCEA